MNRYPAIIFSIIFFIIIIGSSLFATEPDLVLINGTLIDGNGGDPVPDTIILIKEKRITKIGTRATINISSKWKKVIDVQGGTILPGFINSHVHALCRKDAYFTWAKAGVTTVRELMACPMDENYVFRNETNKNPLCARIVMTGPQMTVPGGFSPVPKYNIFISSKDEGIKYTEQILDQGADQIKILIDSTDGLPVLPLESVKDIVEIAHQHGKRVTAHVSQSQDAELAFLAGCDDLAHMVVDELPETLAKKVADSGMLWVPTIEVRMLSGRGKNVINNLHKYVAVGGRVALGTDYSEYIYKFEMGIPLKEINWMMEAGITPMQIIVASTKNAAEACGLEKEIGTIETGKFADIIVTADNPLNDFKTLKQVRTVIHSGVVVKND